MGCGATKSIVLETHIHSKLLPHEAEVVDHPPTHDLVVSGSKLTLSGSTTEVNKSQQDKQDKLDKPKPPSPPPIPPKLKPTHKPIPPALLAYIPATITNTYP